MSVHHLSTPFSLPKSSEPIKTSDLRGEEDKINEDIDFE